MKITTKDYKGKVAVLHGWDGWWIENGTAAIAGPFDSKKEADDWISLQ